MQRPWFGLALAGLVCVASCVKGTPGPEADGDAGFVDLSGGSYEFSACGTQVTTRMGASTPVLGTAVLGTAPTPTMVHLGLAGDARSSIVVQWRTTDETTLATTVQWGKTATSEHATDGATFVYQTGFGSNGDLIRMHETQLCGLAADTEYVYRVGGVGEGGVESWSPEYHFRTAPDLAADPSAEITILVLGDSRGGFETLAQILAQADTLVTPDLVLFSGDAVTLGQLQLEWNSFFTTDPALLARVPIISAHGNHDDNSINYFSQFALPGDEENFSFDYGAMHLTVLNDSPADTADLGTVIPDLLRQDLMSAAAQAAPWRLVMHHRPAYSSAANHGSDAMLQAVLVPIFDQYHVDLVLNGHDHDYERTFPLAAGQVKSTPAEGTVYLVAGGAGAPLYGTGQGFWTAFAESTYNLVVLKIRTGHLELKAYRQDGTVLDQFAIDK